jgi:putative glutamine amidotransferase
MIERDTRIWSAFRAESVMVNSFHHQAVKDAAPGFRVTSRAPDGVIESIEHEDRPFVVGVQWHPEDMWRNNRVYLELFKLFVDSCKG